METMKKGGWIGRIPIIIAVLFLILGIYGLSKSFCFNCGVEKALNIFTFPGAFIFYFFISKNFFNGANPYIIIFIQFLFGFFIGWIIKKIIKLFSSSKNKRGIVTVFIFLLFILFLSNTTLASIQGSIFKIQPTPQDDIKSPFSNVTILLSSDLNLTQFYVYSDENGNFQLYSK